MDNKIDQERALGRAKFEKVFPFAVWSEERQNYTELEHACAYTGWIHGRAELRAELASLQQPAQAEPSKAELVARINAALGAAFPASPLQACIAQSAIAPFIAEVAQQTEMEASGLRKLLAMAYCGSLLYSDDGELQDNREYPFIDFKRDSLEQIAESMRRRAMSNLVAQQDGAREPVAWLPLEMIAKMPMRFQRTYDVFTALNSTPEERRQYTENCYDLTPVFANPSPQSAADPDRYLNEEDFSDLFRFNECCEDFDSGGHDIPKERMRRLEELGVVRNCGFGKHEITAFGDFVIETIFLQSPKLPLKTTEEHNRDAAIKAEADRGKS